MIQRIAKDIYRVEVPFLDIYTTIYVVMTDEGALLFDTATYPEDMDKYAFPAIEELGAELKCVFISHGHRDHAGGLTRVLEKYPGMPVAARSERLKELWDCVFAPEEGKMLLGVLKVVGIPGHAPDAMGLLDTRTGTLLTGDSLQVYGIYGSGNWGANISQPKAHLEALEKIRGMDVRMIAASHDYHPLGNTAVGKAEIDRYLDGCREALLNLRRMIEEMPELSGSEIAEKYNQLGLPTIGTHVVNAMRRDFPVQ